MSCSACWPPEGDIDEVFEVTYTDYSDLTGPLAGWAVCPACGGRFGFSSLDQIWTLVPTREDDSTELEPLFKRARYEGRPWLRVIDDARSEPRYFFKVVSESIPTASWELGKPLT